MKLFIEVKPNAWNEDPYHIVIYKGWKWFKWEIGRVVTRKQLDDFIRVYSELNGQEIKL